jgi:hypothetical protein
MVYYYPVIPDRNGRSLECLEYAGWCVILEMHTTKEAIVAKLLKVLSMPGRYELTVYGPTTDEVDDSRKPVRFVVSDGTREWDEFIQIQTITRTDRRGRSFHIGGHNVSNHAKASIVLKFRGESTMDFTPDTRCNDCGADFPHIHEYCCFCGKKLPRP